MPSPFNVLNRHQTIHQHRMLEASAGTGKTFAIENVVVRFLIEKTQEKNPIYLEQILIVTFTRAATQDLKIRIQRNIQKAIATVKSYLESSSIEEGCADYLQAQLELGAQHAHMVLRRLEQAMFSFDQAQIFTIHGFCSRMLRNFALESNIGLSSQQSETIIEKAILKRVVRDFLRTELSSEDYSQAQLEIILKDYRRDIDKLERDLLSDVEKGLNIASYPCFSESYTQFKLAIKELKRNQYYTSEAIVADFHSQAPFYNKIMNKSGEIHKDILAATERFAALFDKEDIGQKEFDTLIKDGIVILDALDPKNLAKKKKGAESIVLNYPFFIDQLRIILEPVVTQARHKGILYARLTGDCQRFIKRYRLQTELIGHNDLLQNMHRAVSNPDFAEKIRRLYSAAIIDEFQDTDPLQWEIFANLFMNDGWKGYLYLVGDPKQSIYAFRQADIYTYLKAAQHLGLGALSTLDTNFRSQPSLIDALNSLFSASEGLFPLPRQQQSLPYRKVMAGKKANRDFKTPAPPIMFWGAKTESLKKTGLHTLQETHFFPEIAETLIDLKEKEGMDFRQCAILVSDRYQAANLSTYLKSRDIPIRYQKALNLSDSLAFEAMREILDGVLHYRNQSAFKLALTSRLIALTHEEIIILFSAEQPEWLLALYASFDTLRSTLLQQGFGLFYKQLIETIFFPEGAPLLQRLLQREDGFAFYNAWQDIADLLIDKEEREALTAHDLFRFLSEFNPALQDEEDKTLKAYVDAEEDGVIILTTHASKGLEFDIVFALGLMSQTNSRSDRLITVQGEQGHHLVPLMSEDDPFYLQFHMENDAEKMRQLYVALTRAKYRLYIPFVLSQEPTKTDLGKASPIELLLARLAQNSTDYAGWYERLNNQNGSALINFLDEQSGGEIGIKFIEANESETKNVSLPTSLQLIEPMSVTLNYPQTQIHSFTSLQEVIKGQNEIGPAPYLFQIEERSRHTLPAGNETGILLHTILESIPFHLFKHVKESAKLIPYIRPLIDTTPYSTWEGVIAEIVLNTVNNPLFAGGFCLSDLNPKRIYRETEFLYSYQGSENLPEYLTGVIDLLFEHEGKYYLVDWKSNWLGPDDSYYNSESLQRAIKENQYDLQAKIYVEGLRRYLKLFHHEPFEEIFGGTYYIFLRSAAICRIN